MKRGMKLISNAVFLATIVNINLYASSKNWENIDNFYKKLTPITKEFLYTF